MSINNKCGIVRLTYQTAKLSNGVKKVLALDCLPQALLNQDDLGGGKNISQKNANNKRVNG